MRSLSLAKSQRRKEFLVFTVFHERDSADIDTKSQKDNRATKLERFIITGINRLILNL